MRAIIFTEYGAPDVLQLKEVEKPTPKDNEVLLKVYAAAVNPLDWHSMRGSPYIMRLQAGLRKPADTRLGTDVAGQVEAVGKEVTQFKPGDMVLGACSGAFAEYVLVQEKTLVSKPANLTFEQAAAIPVAAITALQGLRDKGQLVPGQKVLINGASGGVGTFAVQIAKAFGAEVTAVCSTRNVEMVRSLGADHVIDYTQENFTQNRKNYDLILDSVGNHSLSAFRRVLTNKGTFVVVGGPDGRWLGPLTHALKAIMLSPFVSQNLVFFLASLSQADLLILKDLVEAEKVTPVIDRSYGLAETADAIRYLETGRARGKVIISVDTTH